jgi:two-component system, OmpR family, phosphate regulon sensor histidine kinase PhoR
MPKLLTFLQTYRRWVLGLLLATGVSVVMLCQVGVTTWGGWTVGMATVVAVGSVCGLFWWRNRYRRQQKRFQTDLLHSIVHEFQTPIAAIRMAVDVLESPIARDNPQRSAKYVRIIREETERLQQQVETMLGLARADRKALTLNIEPIELHTLLLSVAERHGDYLHLYLNAPPLRLRADRVHLTNVLHNLLDNAVKYSEGTPDVRLLTAIVDGMLTIAVRDRGVGIARSQHTKIFRPFYRVGGVDQPSVKGFGLGLSYVQKIVQAHHWQLELTSEPGQGSEFRLVVPANAVIISEQIGADTRF